MGKSPPDETARLRCVACQRIYVESEAMPLRECSSDSCGEIFVDDERACPSCNSPFTRRLADFGCEDCLEELEEEELEAVDEEQIDSSEKEGA